MTDEEVTPEVIAMREHWKDVPDAEVLLAYDADEIMDADTMRRAARLWQRREESAEGFLRFPLGRYYKKNAETDIFVHDIGYIQMSPDRRVLCEESVVRLMESIRKIGLLSPPIVMRRDGIVIDGEVEDNVPVLIAGRHRVEAWRRLGHSKIACIEIRDVSDLDAELIEIAENLHRAELTALQRDEQIARWIVLTTTKREVAAQTEYDEDGSILRQPDAKPGRPEGGVRAAARELRLSEPDARRAVKVASLSPQAKAAAVEAGLDNNRSALLAAARETEPERQVEALVGRPLVAANQNSPGPATYRTSFTGNNEWYTPARYVELARQVLGQIDVDPASNPVAQATVKAATFYTQETNGLDKEWHGTVWMNPPYSQPEIVHFIEKVIAEHKAGRCTNAIVLTHNSTDTAWFNILFKNADAICFTTGRIRFENPEGEKAAPAMGQAFTYFGPRPERFAEVFSEVGNVVNMVRQASAVQDFAPPVRTPMGREWELEDAA
ncbi:hypothetical protein ASD64_14635 [Mesorhizobium sp. Root157]|uniref:DNA N-6-adenine-methyltransferase n=1 Tax=Mesorhizobium sp. Root157 TaxID=1736477 RepID=UPI0007006F5C|nr:DNA N-6-adenine-methyltransferase [Mesorhizobium sp. Root157]KQZ99565.1 hypothetical protein ASD64_14635 [Mesorhizobium sp. Root157]